MENKSRQPRFELKDLITAEDVTHAVGIWAQGRIERGRGEPTSRETAVVGRLALELFLPNVIAGGGFRVQPWKDKYDAGFDKYKEITEGFNPKKLAPLENAARHVAKRLATVAYDKNLQLRMDSVPHKVIGDPELTERLGHIGGTDPQVWQGDNSHRSSLGYIQSDREE